MFYGNTQRSCPQRSTQGSLFIATVYFQQKAILGWIHITQTLWLPEVHKDAAERRIVSIRTGPGPGPGCWQGPGSGICIITVPWHQPWPGGAGWCVTLESLPRVRGSLAWPAWLAGITLHWTLGRPTSISSVVRLTHHPHIRWEIGWVFITILDGMFPVFVHGLCKF